MSSPQPPQINNGNVTRGDPSLPYSDLLTIIRELVQLRVNLTSSNPKEESIKNYKLLKKVFEAYDRIKQHPEIMIDTISTVSDNKIKQNTNNTTQNVTQNATQNAIQSAMQSAMQNTTQGQAVNRNYNFNRNQNNNSDNKNSVLYLFNNDNARKDDSSDDDSDTEPEALFTNYKHESLPDDKDVESLIKKSKMQLSRALRNRNYTTIQESDEPGDDSDNENKGDAQNKAAVSPPSAPSTAGSRPADKNPIKDKDKDTAEKVNDPTQSDSPQPPEPLVPQNPPPHGQTVQVPQGALPPRPPRIRPVRPTPPQNATATRYQPLDDDDNDNDNDDIYQKYDNEIYGDQQGSAATYLNNMAGLVRAGRSAAGYSSDIEDDDDGEPIGEYGP